MDDNVQAIVGEWPPANPAVGTFALVNHVVYLTPAIVPFVRTLEKAGRPGTGFYTS